MLACNAASLHTLTPPDVVFRVLARPFALCSVTCDIKICKVLGLYTCGISHLGGSKVTSGDFV